MKVIVISDTHNEHDRLKLPPCDLLIHAGDFTVDSSLKEIRHFGTWFSHQNAKIKILIAGNHDHLFATNKLLAKRYLHPTITYLHNTGVILPNGLRVWGSPVVPRNRHEGFVRPRGEAMRQHWEIMPEGIDILVTHVPPEGLLDRNKRGESCGCEHLRRHVDRMKPRLHCFGHIHESHGTLERDGTRFVNAAFLHKRDLSGHEYIAFDL